MAIARLAVKVGKVGKAAAHAAYITRAGQYANRLEQGERLEATEAGNLPAWAQADPLAFWQAADAHERANGTTYREFEIALPRELTPDERTGLVRAFVHQELGERHAYQWAIHCPLAIDGQAQPHAHLMFSERQRDGIERDPAQYFKRYNAKAPEQGGARKGWGARAGQTLTRAERVAELKALRGRWEILCNEHLERAGRLERIDMRSHAERGLGLLPERKFLPSEWRTRQAEVLEFRQARAALARTVPDLGGELFKLEERRREAARPRGARSGPAVQSARFKTRPKRAPRPGSRAALAAELAKIDSTLPIAQQAEAFLAVGNRLVDWRGRKACQASDRASRRYGRRYQALCDALAARRQATPTGLLGVFKQKAYQAARAAHDRADVLHVQASALAHALKNAAQPEAVKAWTWAQLEQAAPELTARVKAHRAETERQQRAQERQAWERDALARAFQDLAARRALKATGYQDTSDDWQATPKLLREILDDYNRRPKDQQERALAAWMRDPEKSKAIAALIEQRRERTREHGRSR